MYVYIHICKIHYCKKVTQLTDIDHKIARNTYAALKRGTEKCCTMYNVHCSYNTWREV